jgi:1,4-alpha-glucan branching enzyme
MLKIMKKTILLALTLVFISCKNDKETDKVSEKLAAFTNEAAENAVIYEANIRQYSPEGTFEAFTKDIPELKKLGVKVIWVMPIQPISMTKRKATDGRVVTEIEDEKERAKYLGSYYSISDYRGINADMGSKSDFQDLVQTAHDNGMYVILDWVANHTGWDHKWIKTNPEYYHKNAKGEVTDPLNPETGESWGWTDVAHLDYSNPDLHEVMKEEMLYWVKELNIDGFRCDVADNVPTSFWEFAVPKLREAKPLFMLMESNKEYLFKNDLFDMGYGWEAHHLMNDLNKNKKTVADIDSLFAKIKKEYPSTAYFMNFTSNHDENSWNGTEYERMGDGVEALTALTYMMPGMPLIYTGQEYELKRRLKFFEKDSIPKTKGKMFALYEKLGALKNNNSALNGAKKAAIFNRIKTSNDKMIMAFTRANKDKKVIYLGNLSGQNVNFTLPLEGTFVNYLTNEKVIFTKQQKHLFKPWEYYIFVPE